MRAPSLRCLDNGLRSRHNPRLKPRGERTAQRSVFRGTNRLQPDECSRLVPFRGRAIEPSDDAACGIGQQFPCIGVNPASAERRLEPHSRVAQAVARSRGREDHTTDQPNR